MTGENQPGEFDVDALIRERDAAVLAARISARAYKRAQARTFELSARIQEVEAGAAPLRALLAEVIEHSVPTTNCHALPQENVWRRARVAADGGPALLSIVADAPCDVCDGTGDIFVYQGEGDHIENPCGACGATGVAEVTDDAR